MKFQPKISVFISIIIESPNMKATEKTISVFVQFVLLVRKRQWQKYIANTTARNPLEYRIYKLPVHYRNKRNALNIMHSSVFYNMFRPFVSVIVHGLEKRHHAW